MNDMKRAAVWLVLISYTLIACGDMLDSGCCRIEAAHASDEHSTQEHSHSKVLFVVHALSHSVVPENTQRVGPKHCCCVEQGGQTPGFPPHLIAKSHAPKPLNFPSAVASVSLDVPAVVPGTGSLYLLNNPGTAFIFPSIHTTILLI
ncbi:hypothetical protein Desti_0676 [Desulfomonile tiedjei DSM 6799]|uniref:Uncharacterized protein n=1 Tax=Desulfomonile tiedjei (strain ATCC 49306 / DSM 6799 / DCB-1) TaxID=706587 RepID=I4C1G1_DESTA|nr:hypothetical protein Desti_0676 [Desulfomonile tiedjei DSM 6799]